ncbi:G-type lectin S-receptor-like serine/threonine-protein kinase At2g19130 [Malus sylvestris]|uniref:G-type lectin S-receptor-like serine/threonine-protein kinase At2g19130 n=1 Tax=Malus sylvestris TaxID=3752 RepID=UPI0021AD1C8B|nr:G-type lectin S-receptor-like serine/threonine-protein kinase At2g19130 [Malus sylvestris]
MDTKILLCYALRFLLCCTFIACISTASHTISPGQSLTKGQTITSPSGTFELGFFTPGNSRHCYVGIWYKNLPNLPVVWVANRKQPVSAPIFLALELVENGNLTLSSPSKVAVWSTNSRSEVSNSSVAKLLDNGNFVITDAFDSSVVLWQSFDHLSNTWLPGAELGYNNRTKRKLVLTSWRNVENPAPGPFSFELDELPFNLSDHPDAFTRGTLEINGQLNFYYLDQFYSIWNSISTLPSDRCEVNASCGAFSICDQQGYPHCGCLEGFEPKVRENWGLQDFSDGCVRKIPFNCSSGDSFLEITGVAYPQNFKEIFHVSFDQCRSECLINCSCTAFAYNFSDSHRCYMWTGDLYNIRATPYGSDSIRYSRGIRSYSPDSIGLHLRIVGYKYKITWSVMRKTTWMSIGLVAGLFSILSAATYMLFFRRRWSAGALATAGDSLVLYKHRDLRRATKNFSQKLGEGAFGSVFKGMLPHSTAIAVKELKSMNQGEKQFRAEVGTIGVIQHINLIRMRGFCVSASKRFLVYDYMPNGSLQSLLLGKNPTMLDWKTRYHIAVGTARGLAYLHEDCRDCIIHCDVKPENILLDSEYSPKLADFGLAKLLGRHHSRVLTTMRGTVGYLAPEWFSGEAITPKADVFSYGMVLIEVISGRRNREGLDDGVENFRPIRFANAVNKGEDLFALLDCRLEGQADGDELSRACKVACWCIQEDEKDRPKMKKVVQILEGVSDIGVPPVPRFLQRLIGGPSEGINNQETTSGSGSWSCSDVQSAFQAQVSNCAFQATH